MWKLLLWPKFKNIFFYFKVKFFTLEKFILFLRFTGKNNKFCLYFFIFIVIDLIFFFVVIAKIECREFSFLFDGLLRESKEKNQERMRPYEEEEKKKKIIWLFSSEKLALFFLWFSLIFCLLYWVCHASFTNRKTKKKSRRAP